MVLLRGMDNVDQMRKEGLIRMEREIQSIARDEGLNVVVIWLSPPKEYWDSKLYQVDGKMAKVTAGGKETRIVFDWSEITDFGPESGPVFIQKIRTKIREKVREMKDLEG